MRGDYVTIQDFMCFDLKLSGNELLVYALIYGFSKDGSSEFYGSRKYISEWFNISLPTVDKSINSLIQKNLIRKRTNILNGVAVNYYSAILECINDEECKESLPSVKKLDRGCKESLPGGCKESLPNNTNINKTNYNNSNSRKTLLPKSSKSKKSKFIDNFLNICDEFEFSENVLSELKSFAEMLSGSNSYLADETIYAQLQALYDRCGNDSIRIKVIKDTLVRGWKSLIYCIDNNCKTNKITWQSDDISCKANDVVPGTDKFNNMVDSGDIEYF